MKDPKKNKKKLPGNEAINQLQFPGIHPGMPLEEVREELKSEDTDPLGSYTGNPIDEEVPVQDVDDL